MKRALPLFTVLLLVARSIADSPATAPDGPQPQSLPTATLKVGSKEFKLQIADDDDRREIGLMYVKSMPADRGMIFLFPSQRVLSFWMKNTPIDLDIIYVNHFGRITAIKTMYAFKEDPISSEDAADVAIELNAGEAGKTGVKTGDKLDIPDSLRSRAR